MSTKKVLGFVGAAIGLVVLFIWLAGGFVRTLPVEQAQRSQAHGQDVDERRADNSFEVIQVEVPRERAFSGTLQARQQANLAARITARVADVLVDAGNQVQAGDLLVRLESDDLSARVRQQEQQLAAAQARVNEARSNYTRISSMVENGLLPQASLDEARARRDTAEAELSGAREALSEAETSEGFSMIVAPFDGVISRRMVFTGDTATPGMQLVSIYQPRSLRMEAGISESALAHISIGQTIPVWLDAHERWADAQVEEIEPAADAASRSFIARLTLLDTDGVYPGMYGKINVTTGQRQVILIPPTALRQMGQLNFVQVLVSDSEGQRQERRMVRLGEVIQYNGQPMQEIVAGLAANEHILLAR